MLGRMHKLAMASLTSLILLAAFASNANAESRHGMTSPSRQMMRSHGMMHRPMIRHRMMMRHQMMRRHTM